MFVEVVAGDPCFLGNGGEVDRFFLAGQAADSCLGLFLFSAARFLAAWFRPLVSGVLFAISRCLLLLGFGGGRFLRP